MTDILFPFKPDFGDGLSVSLTYKTDILRSYSGKEQRRSVLDRPRKVISFTVLEHGKRALDLLMFVKNNMNSTILVPDRSSGLTLKYPIGTSNLLTLTEPKFVFHNGQQALIEDPQGNSELITVENQYGPSDFSVHLTAALTTAYPEGTILYPILRCRMDDTTKLKLITAETVQIDFDFTVETTIHRDANQFLYKPRIPYTLNGKPVFMEQINFDKVDLEFNQESDKVDFQTGLIEWFPRENFGTITTKGEYFGTSPRVNQRLFDFLQWSKGRCKEFYMASVNNDLKASRLPVKGERVIFIHRCDYILNATTLENDTSLGIDRRVLITDSRGMVFDHTVFDFQHDSATETKLFIGEDLATDREIVTIRFLNLTRMASDKFELRWVNDAIFRLMLSFQQLFSTDLNRDPDSSGWSLTESDPTRQFSSFNRVVTDFFGTMRGEKFRYIEDNDLKKYLFEFEIVELDSAGLEVGIGCPIERHWLNSHYDDVITSGGSATGYGYYGFYGLGGTTTITVRNRNFKQGDVVSIIIVQENNLFAEAHFYVNGSFVKTEQLLYLTPSSGSAYRPYIKSLSPSVLSTSIVKLNTGQEHFRVIGVSAQNVEDWN